MKKWLSLLLLIMLLLSARSTSAQATYSNPLGGNITVQDAGTCSTTNSFLWQHLPVNAATTTINLAGTFSATVTVRESNNGGGSWTTAATLTTAGTTTYATNGFTDICTDVTTFTSGSVGISISTGLNTGPVGPAGPAGVGSVVNNAASNPLGVSINVKAAPYNAKGDTQQTLANVSTIAAGSGGCPSAAPNGFCFVIPSGNPFPQLSDIGKVGYANYTGSGVNMATPALIANVNAGTGAQAGNQIVGLATTTTSGGCGGSNCIFVWGTDDTLALQQAAGAAHAIGILIGCSSADQLAWQPTCVNMYYPPGGYMTSGGGTTTPGGPGFPGISTGIAGSQIGSGISATTFFLRPDYSIGALGGNNGAFLHNGSQLISDFQITGSGFNFGFGSNPIVVNNAGATTLARVRITQIGNLGGIIVSGGSHSIVDNLIVQDPAAGNASALCDFNGGILDVYNIFCSNNNSTTSPNLAVRNYTGGTSGQRITFHGGQIDECSVTGTSACTSATAAKDVGFFGTTLLGGANTSLAVNVDATSEVRCSSCILAPFGGNASSDVTVAAGGKFSATLTKFIAFGGTRWVWSCGDANACVDDGGNIYTLLSGASLYAAGSFAPTFSLANNAITQLGGRQIVAGNTPTFAVTGFGTGPTVSIQTGSTDAAGAAIITAGTTPGSSGTFTLTFSTSAGAYGTNKPVCTFTLIDGTGAWNSLAQEPRGVDASTSTTSVLANWSDNSVALTAASTYGFNWSCYGK